MTIDEINSCGRTLEQSLILRYAPIAVRLLKSEADTPDGCVRPFRDRGQHLAICQAFALVRRERHTIAMFNDDHHCPFPMIAIGSVPFRDGTPGYEMVTPMLFTEDPDKSREFFKQHWPRLPEGSYAGMALAPLSDACFEPDVTLIYCNSAQLRSLLMAAKFKSGKPVVSEFDSIDSCAHSLIPAITKGDYRITIPDPGEYERALTDEDEMIFSVPQSKLSELIAGVEAVSAMGMGYRGLHMEMFADFPRPPFYTELFQGWGLG
ncbi:MAG: DUF169 domain-containing protein [Oscillospiraceae bacterium]|jgi:uncharacterized protein (DUF169 family)|nr:DUF169 domain-containing protein [Oscillospiraceae bacterium]